MQYTFILQTLEPQTLILKFTTRLLLEQYPG